MKNASEMRIIAEAEVEKVIQKKKDKAVALVEGTISNLVHAAATLGYFDIRYPVDDEGVDIEYAIEFMRSFGYAIDRYDRYLIIRW